MIIYVIVISFAEILSIIIGICCAVWCFENPDGLPFIVLILHIGAEIISMGLLGLADQEKNNRYRDRKCLCGSRRDYNIGLATLFLRELFTSLAMFLLTKFTIDFIAGIEGALSQIFMGCFLIILGIIAFFVIEFLLYVINEDCSESLLAYKYRNDIASLNHVKLTNVIIAGMGGVVSAFILCHYI